MNSVVAFLHSNYLENTAGVEKVVLEQEHVFRLRNIDFFVVIPICRKISVANKNIPLRTKEYLIIKNGKIYKRTDIYQLTDWILEEHTITLAIIHHLSNFEHDEKMIVLMETISKRIKTIYYIHDYASICFNHVLMKNGKKYCGEQDVSISLRKCWNCKYYLFAVLDESFYRKFMDRVNIYAFVFPSEVVREIWLKKYSNLIEKTMVVPHQIFSEEMMGIDRPLDKVIKVSYVGYASKEKGWNFWKKVVKEISGYKEIRCYMLGKTNENLDGVQHEDVSFHGNKDNAMVDKLISKGIHIAFLWSECPETYSYTFFESYIAGCYVVTGKNSGNIARMVDHFKCGRVFNKEEDFIEWIKNVEIVKKELNNFYSYNTQRPRKLLPNDFVLKFNDYL